MVGGKVCMRERRKDRNRQVVMVGAVGVALGNVEPDLGPWDVEDRVIDSGDVQRDLLL